MAVVTDATADGSRAEKGEDVQHCVKNSTCVTPADVNNFDAHVRICIASEVVIISCAKGTDENMRREHAFEKSGKTCVPHGALDDVAYESLV
jgi:hypothetical protein